MAASVMFTPPSERQSAPRAFDNDSQQYIHYLGNIVHSEPIVERCMDSIISNTLIKGVSCGSVDGAESATAGFRDFVNRHYVSFAKDAIRMFFVLGFAVWRIRRITELGVRQLVPEVLPLGSFTWNVRTAPRKQDRDWQATYDANEAHGGGIGGVNLSKKLLRRGDDMQLTYYDVVLSGVECDYNVFEFIRPDLVMECVSPLSSVIPFYIRLQVARACKMRTEEWNSTPRFTVEHNEKFLMNQMADDGQSLNTQSQNADFDSLYEDTLGDATDARGCVVRKQAEKAGLPPNTHLFVLPKNHGARFMDSVEGPTGMPDAELEFQRSVCYAMGVPCSLVMQAYQVGRQSSASGSANESTVQSMQMLRNTCTKVGKSLETLLGQVYEQSYGRKPALPAGGKKKSESEKDVGKPGAGHHVRFSINCTPLLELADITELHFRRLVDDGAVDEMLLASIGFPLNKSAERLPWNRTVQGPQPDSETKQAGDAAGTSAHVKKKAKSL